MSTIDYIKEHFDRLQSAEHSSSLQGIRQQAFQAFSKWGIPTVKHEEWKYTRISGLFNKAYQLPPLQEAVTVSPADIASAFLPGHEQANALVFVNGLYMPSLSVIRSAGLRVIQLEDAASGEFKEVVAKNLGHSRHYLKDGINALSTAFLQGAVFMHVPKGCTLEHPVYIYNITDARSASILAQPRSLVFVQERANVEIVETFATLGMTDSFTNQVMEMVVEQDAVVEYYKIQNDVSHATLVSTTHIRQTGKSEVHTVTISLGEGIVRNNLNMVLDAERCESHLYGLYLQQGNGHIDNHTIVDNVSPNCYSNELYKGVMDGHATGVFNGKIFVRQDAQKTNAYQSNKNILLSDNASVNTKPQLEIFADDVKCSHGCTVGRLDDEGLFYLRSRGIREKIARSLLLHAFAVDVLEQIKNGALRQYIDKLIEERLEIDQL